MKVLKPGFDSGFRYHLGYIFPLTANDISVNYAHLRDNSKDEVSAPSGGVLWTITNGSVRIYFDTVPLSFPVIADRAKATVEIDWRMANIEFGTRVKFYDLMTRFLRGLYLCAYQ